MTREQLAEELSSMYENAPDGDKVATIHLFGIKYAKIIRQNNYVPGDILSLTELSNGSTMQASYSAEINKGINLAKYVIEKKAIKKLLDE